MLGDYSDGPASPLFEPIEFCTGVPLQQLPQTDVSQEMSAAFDHAPRGECVGWGIPFVIGEMVVLGRRTVRLDLGRIDARWLIFMHTSDLRLIKLGPGGFFSPMRGEGALGELAANYVMEYENGREILAAVRRRHQVGGYRCRWGENCFEAVPHGKPHPVRAAHEQPSPGWGASQKRVAVSVGGPWINWLWAWENPYPSEAIIAIRLEPVSGALVFSAVSAGHVRKMPLRWDTRHKAVLTLPRGESFKPDLDERGLLQQIQLDLGQVISATPRQIYPNEGWAESYSNQLPHVSPTEVLVEYTAHPEAFFHFPDKQTLAVAEVESGSRLDLLRVVNPASQEVQLRVLERGSNGILPMKLHVHGEQGEYLSPVDRHRIPNPAWFEDYGVDFSSSGLHHCTYIPGETTIHLPLGRVYVEVSKGFEVRPVRKAVDVTEGTQEIIIEIEKVLPWRDRGWVTADTHVHFLSPTSALLEGAAEGVNVVNLLATQLGEMMANVGDFDGRMTWGSREAGGDGEHLVRVGTENRQQVLGHISLLGYSGRIITPLTTGGPLESALGDPVALLLTEWAQRCRQQGGVVVLPHFPDPRAENAVTIVCGEADAVEMTSWGNLYGGIDPYSLSDWYRFLNCGYLVPAVGGTDKMSAATAVGTVRTYARLPDGAEFSYDTWKEAIRRKETFVTYGPLLEFSVDGHPMGSCIAMSRSGGTVDVLWQVASVTIPMSRVELIVNGEIRESDVIGAERASGHWSIDVKGSSWLALLVRGHYSGKPEIIAAHSSPVMVMIEGSQVFAAADAITILEQIEGVLAYIDTIGTRAEDLALKRMRLFVASAHRRIHNQMHALGYYHKHSPVTDHEEHSSGAM